MHIRLWSAVGAAAARQSAHLQVLSISDTTSKNLPAIMGTIAATFGAMVNIKRKDGTR